jgi:hypothetical protein
MAVYDFTYVSDPNVKMRCMKCGEEITEDEVEYEDYFTVFRGHSKEAFAGYVCFACLKE